MEEEITEKPCPSAGLIYGTRGWGLQEQRKHKKGIQFSMLGIRVVPAQWHDDLAALPVNGFFGTIVWDRVWLVCGLQTHAPTH